MKLNSVKVTNFRSIEDSDEVSINDVTCLVGKNESGKTTFLKALHLLNPLNPIRGKNDYDDTIDYPSKNFSKYKKIRKTQPAEVIKATFELTENEVSTIESELGEGFLTSKLVIVTRQYDSAKRYYTAQYDESVAVKSLIAGLELTDSDKQAIESTTSISNLLTALNAINEPHSTITSLIKKIEGWRDNSISLHLIDTYWHKWLPLFFYFDDYSTMDGRINIAQLREREENDELSESDKTFLALLKTIEAELEDFETDGEDPEEYERLVRELEAASTGITQEVFKYWSQNKSLRVRFDIEPNGKFISIRISNDRHHVTVPFNERSRGFIWFFSFFAYFSDIEDANTGKDIVLLLDEPGLSLHAKAQEDFLKLINERLAPEHQVIYTTHSPFMIEASRLDRVRTVEDVDEEGTKISEDVLRTDQDTVYPLQAALGYSLAQTLFVGPNTLLVEGPSDIIYLQILSQVAIAQGKAGLDDRWVVVPVGGADKLATFVSLLGANQLNVAVLMDISNKDGQRIKRLQETGYLGKNSLMTFGQFTGAKDADIEDIFEENFYLQLVNNTYKDKLSSTIKMADIKTGNPRIVVRVSEQFAKQGVEAKFNHYLPAAYLLKDQATLLPKISQATVDQAVTIFEAVNKLIP